MYEAVHAHPDGESTVARLAATARDYGYEGIVVRNHGDAGADYDAGAIRDAYDLDVASGVEVRADEPSRLRGYVGNHRPDRTVVLVHGGTNAVNRAAVEQVQVDVLAHPMAGDGDVNHVLARRAAENGVRLECDLGPVLRSAGGSRVHAVRGLRKLRELVDAFDVPYVVSADPSSHLHLRAPRELAAVGESIGFSADEIEHGLAEWGRLVSRNRERQSESFIEPGVREGPYEEDA